MKKLFTRIYLIIALSIGLACDATAQDKGLRFVVHHSIGQQPLTLGTAQVNALGDTVIIRRFRYYLSNFSLIDRDGKETKVPDQYFLVDEETPGSKSFILPVKADNIVGIRFLIGVDSLKNVSGVQDGALDPTKGMFWTWNTGYISAKLEGESPSSSAARQTFTYHIGGYRSPYATMRSVSLPVTVTNGELHLNADINQWFRGQTDLLIAKNPVCHSVGALAARIADNYATMFSLYTAP